jgi:hypothetical protein
MLKYEFFTRTTRARTTRMDMTHTYYATRTWRQKTGENIGKLTDNDEIQLIKALNKLVKYEYAVNGVKNRRGR